MKNESIYPSYIDNTDFRYIKIDDKYIASLIIYDFPQYNSFLSITESIPKDIEYTMSIYVQKQDTYKILKELMYSISTSKSEIKTAKDSQIDIDIITKLKDDANNLRKEIQINNQEVFYINFILTFYSNSSEKLIKKLKRFQSRLYSKQLYSKIANFRQLDEYILSLPLNRKENIILKQNFRNLTTNALSNIFPFYTKTIFDLTGIVFGKIISENSICSIDMFKKKYLNSNMCILGSSGAGKSFFAKLLIIRHYINNKSQFIFDVEGEYTSLVEKLGGTVFSFKYNHINILEFTNIEISEYKSKVYSYKIKNVVRFLKDLLNINDDMILKDIENAIVKSYTKYGITEDLNTLFVKYDDRVYLNKVLKNSKDFPNLNDVVEELSKKETKEIFKEMLKNYPYLFGTTDVDFKNRLITFDISSIKITNTMIVIKYILENIIFKLRVKSKEKLNLNNTIIYIDEVWKYISQKNSMLFEYIFELFKTIRKLNASIVVITQDIGDIFSKENENYGKSILNNCFFKVIFRLDFSDIEVLNRISGIDNKILENVNMLDKGESLLLFNNNNIKLLIKANEYEEELIKGDENEYFSCN